MDPYNPFGYTLPPTMPVYVSNAAPAPTPAPYGFDLHSVPRQPLAPLPNNLPLMSLPAHAHSSASTLHANPNSIKRAASTSALDQTGQAKRPAKPSRASSAKPSLTAANNKHLEPLLPSYTANIAGPASDENTPFNCPRCDKIYKGKHARSIWRRHMQDKHGVALKDQPRRTRWDNGKSRAPPPASPPPAFVVVNPSQAFDIPPPPDSIARADSERVFLVFTRKNLLSGRCAAGRVFLEAAQAGMAGRVRAGEAPCFGPEPGARPALACAGSVRVEPFRFTSGWPKRRNPFFPLRPGRSKCALMAPRASICFAPPRSDRPLATRPPNLQLALPS